MKRNTDEYRNEELQIPHGRVVITSYSIHYTKLYDEVNESTNRFVMQFFGLLEIEIFFGAIGGGGMRQNGIDGIPLP